MNALLCFGRPNEMRSVVVNEQRAVVGRTPHITNRR